MRKKISIFFVLLVFFSCLVDSSDKGNKKEEVDPYKILFQKNLNNLKNGSPFYIIRLEAFLLFDKPDKSLLLPNSYIKLKYGDVLFPVPDVAPVREFFYVKTIYGQYGWIHNNYGISINYLENEDFSFFNETNYLKQYRESQGNVDNSSLIVLAKNVVPLLLDNYKVEGWFYPSDYQLAYEISNFVISLAEEKNTFFQSATVLFSWNVNEYVVAYNLLADSCHKLGLLDKAEEIHLNLIKKHFWKYYDNSRIGGLNSVIKLELIYIDMLKKLEKGTKSYNAILDKMIENILIIGDKYNDSTVIDKNWHLTTAEWVLDILRNSFERADFYYIVDLLKKRTYSEGFADMIELYIALEMYKEGKQDEALTIITSLKPKKNFQAMLRVNDWLYEKKIVPESVIYQYKF